MVPSGSFAAIDEQPKLFESSRAACWPSRSVPPVTARLPPFAVNWRCAVCPAGSRAPMVTREFPGASDARALNDDPFLLRSNSNSVRSAVWAGGPALLSRMPPAWLTSPSSVSAVSVPPEMGSVSFALGGGGVRVAGVIGLAWIPHPCSLPSVPLSSATRELPLWTLRVRPAVALRLPTDMFFLNFFVLSFLFSARAALLVSLTLEERTSRPMKPARAATLPLVATENSVFLPYLNLPEFGAIAWPSFVKRAVRLPRLKRSSPVRLSVSLKGGASVPLPVAPASVVVRPLTFGPLLPLTFTFADLSVLANFLLNVRVTLLLPNVAAFAAGAKARIVKAPTARANVPSRTDLKRCESKT